jgi:hypothetical protein
VKLQAASKSGATGMQLLQAKQHTQSDCTTPTGSMAVSFEEQYTSHTDERMTRACILLLLPPLA